MQAYKSQTNANKSQTNANKSQTNANKSQTNANKTTAYEAKELARQKGKPFCKVCFDAGKSDQEYMSHYVKSGLKLVCPTLLNQACLTCGERGHTSGYCDQKIEANTRPRPSSSIIGAGTIGAGTIGAGTIGAGTIGAEAELRILSATKSINQAQEFPSLPSKQPEPEPEQFEPKPEPEVSQNHVYNPRSNAFGALTIQRPKQNSKQKHENTQPQQPQKPMTMADRLKNPAPKPITATTVTTVIAPVKPKFADLPPKSQFWWQDEDD